MAGTAAALNILVNAQVAGAMAQIKAVDAQLKKTAATATGTGGAFGKLNKGTLAAGAGIGALAVGAGVAAKQLYDVGKELDQAYDTIRSGTGATGKQLERLKSDFRDVAGRTPADLADAGTAIADLNTRLGLTGKPLRRMSQQMLELSEVTGSDLEGSIKGVSRAFVDWEVPVRKQTKTLDGFFRLSQASGSSVEEITTLIQQFGSPLRTLGFNVNEAASMFAQFERAGVNIQTMVPGLKLAIGNLSSGSGEAGKQMEKFNINGKDLHGSLMKIFKLISNEGIPTQERMNLAMGIFGKRAGADMREAISQGRFDLEKFMDIMKNGKDTIHKTAVDTRDAGENFKILGNQLKVAVAPAADKIYQLIGDISGALVDLDIGKYIKLFGDLTLSGGALIGNILSGDFKGAASDAKNMWNALAGDDTGLTRLQKIRQAVKVSGRILSNSADKVKGAWQKQRHAVKAEAEAEKNLREARKKHGAGSGPVLRAEAKLQQAKRKTIRLTDRAKKAEREHGVMRKIAATQLRTQAGEEKAAIVRQTKTIKRLRHLIAVEYKRNGLTPKVTKLQQKLGDTEKKRSKKTKHLNETLEEAGTRIGPRFAKSLKNMSDKTATLLHSLPQLPKPVNRFREGLQDVLPPLKDIGPATGKSFGKADHWVKLFAKTVGNRRAAINKNMRDMPPVTKDALGRMWEQFQDKSDAIDSGGKPRLKGFAAGGMVPVALSPGEMVTYGSESAIVPGRPTKRDSVRTSLPTGAKVFTYDGQRRLAAGASERQALASQRPHFAGGGIVEPKVYGGSTKARGVANKMIGSVHDAAAAKLKKERASSLGGVSGSMAGPIGAIVANVLSHFPGLSVTSGYRPGDVGSFHGVGRAADLGGSTSLMYKASDWIRTHIGRSLTEGIHNPNLSVDGGVGVPASFWGPETWAAHANHIHLAKRRGGLIQRLASGGIVKTAKVARRAGWRGKDLMTAIAVAGAESGYDPLSNLVTGAEDSRGLWQINTKAHGGGNELYHPMTNAKVAYSLWKSQGWGPWAGYTSGNYRDFLGRARGAMKTARLGLSGGGSKQKNSGPGPYQTHGGAAPPGQKQPTKKAVQAAKAALSKANKRWRERQREKITSGALNLPLLDRIASLGQHIARVQEDAGIRETRYGFASSEAGEELSDNETRDLVRIYTGVLGFQLGQSKMNRRARRVIQARLKENDRNIRTASKNGMRWKLPAFKKIRTDLKTKLGTLNTDYETLRGLTGQGGDVWDTRQTLERLGAKSTDTAAVADNSEIVGLLREQLAASQRNLAISQAQMPIFQQFMPKYHSGGIIPGGTERPVMAMGGEGIFTRDQMAAMGGGGEWVVNLYVNGVKADPAQVRMEVERAGRGEANRVRRGNAGAPKYRTAGLR